MFKNAYLRLGKNNIPYFHGNTEQDPNVVIEPFVPTNHTPEELAKNADLMDKLNWRHRRKNQKLRDRAIEKSLYNTAFSNQLAEFLWIDRAYRMCYHVGY